MAVAVSRVNTRGAVEEDAVEGGQRILQNGILNLAAQLLYAGLQLVVVFLLVRQLGRADLGRYYTLVATILTAQLVIEGGAGTILTQRLTQAGTDWKGRISETTGLFAAIALSSVLVFFAIGAVWSCLHASLPWMLCFVAAGISCGAMQVQRFSISIFQAFELFYFENAAKILQVALFLALVFGCLAADTVALDWVFAAHAASHIAASIFLFAALRRHAGPIAWRLNWRTAVRQWVEGFPLGIADVLRRLIWQVDTILLALMTAPAVVGVYSVAYRALGPLNWIPRALLSAAFPSLARTAGDIEKTSRAFGRSTRLLLVISIPIAIAVCTCAGPIVEILAGPEFAEAAGLMQILIWTIILSFTSVQFRYLFTALNRRRTFVWLTVLVLLLKIAIEVALIPYLGYFGACLGSLAAELILFAGGLLSCRFLGVTGVDWRGVGRAVIAGAVMAALLWTVHDQSLALLGLVIGLALLLYVTTCTVLGAVKPDEVQQYTLLLRRLFRLPQKSATACDGVRGGGDTGRIAEAARRWQNLRMGQAGCSDTLTADQLATALSSRVKSCQVWRANWRNRIYRVTLGDGTMAIAKQACIEQTSELACEFAWLQRLAALEIEHLRVPQPIAYLSSLQTYLMETASGEPLDVLFRQRRAREFVRGCGLAGEVLAQVHNDWTTGCQRLPVDRLTADLLSIPLKLTRTQREAVRAALQSLSEQRTPTGQPYLDFKAANVLFDGRNVTLIDPPEEELDDEPLAWDVAVFGVSVDHELWKCVARGSWRGARRTAHAGVAQFERKYYHHLAGPHLALSEFRLLVQILRLQRLGQLIALQRSKLQAGQIRRFPFTSMDSRLLGTLAEAIPLPLLKARAHRSLDRIARSVRERTALSLARIG